MPVDTEIGGRKDPDESDTTTPIGWAYPLPLTPFNGQARGDGRRQTRIGLLIGSKGLNVARPESLPDNCLMGPRLIVLLVDDRDHALRRH